MKSFQVLQVGNEIAKFKTNTDNGFPWSLLMELIKADVSEVNSHLKISKFTEQHVFP